jgi:hypothetical protein
MKTTKTFIFLLLICFTAVNSRAQENKLSFFGSYNYGFGFITPKVDPELRYPLSDEVKKLKSGTVNQFEIGLFYRLLGVAFIHNSYVKDASTSYDNTDLNNDGYTENGIIRDKLRLNFNGLEMLYKIPVFQNRFDITWKIGLGFQLYYIKKDFNIMGSYPNYFSYTLKQTKLTAIAGIELNYQLWKMIGIGLETSILPGNYSNLKNSESPSSIYKDNVTRLSAGLKIRIII